MTQIHLVIIFLVGFLLLLAGAQLMYLKLKIDAEYSRKFSHIIAAITSILFAYVFDSHIYVLIICGSFFLLLLLTKQKHIFGSIENIKRISGGSFLFPAGIYISFILADPSDNKVLYIIPLLHLGLADGLAGLLGYRYGKREIKIYKFNLHKTYMGSSVFFLSSVAISYFCLNILNANVQQIQFIFILYLALISTLTEMFSPWGTDNITVPIVTYWILSSCII